MKRLTLLAALAVCCSAAQTQNINIIPRPQQVELTKGNFTITPATTIVLQNGGLANEAALLNEYLKKYYGFALKTTTKAQGNTQAITLKNQQLSNPTEGAYTLQSGPKGISISSRNNTGIFYGIQSLIQLLPLQKTKTLNVPAVTIEDAPRFSYRGMHLDVGRHFMPVDFIKRYIDYLAAFKMNTFHWHLTEDQGWRIEIKKYPLLTQVGAWRNGTIIGHYPGKGNTNERTGGFYTQAEIKAIVKYAADRHITIIPEIEMPGHSEAAIAAYPYLSCFPAENTIIGPNASEVSKQTKGKLVQETWGVHEDVFIPTDSTFKFLEDVLDEVMALFPSKYIHIGGDECPKSAWQRNEFCQKLIKEKGLKDEHGLQSYFIGRIEKYLNSKGRNIIGWDEILEGGLAPNATVMSWRGEAGGIAAAKEKHTVIMTPGNWCYFDHSQVKNDDSLNIGGFTPLDEVYGYEPVPAALQGTDEAKYVLGTQANVWTEYMSNPSKVEYMIFPRTAAMSEVQWTNKENKSWSNFESRIPALFKRFDWWKTNYSKAWLQQKSEAPKTAPAAENKK